MNKSTWELKRLEDNGLPSWEDKLLIDEAIEESTKIIKKPTKENHNDN